MTEQSQTKERTSRHRGPSLKAILSFTVVAVVLLAVGVIASTPLKTGYAKLIETLKGDEHAGHDHAAGDYYTCGMHPWVVLPKPGDCPICRMKLTPIDPNKFTGEIAIDPLVVQNIGVRIEPVTTGPLVRTVRTVGTIDYDETTVRDVNIKVNGWIEKLHIDYLGAKVKDGQPLFEIYSPELYSAQEEFLLAWKNRDKIGATSQDLLDAARTKLEYYDITAKQIEAITKTGKATKTMSILSPHTGVVTSKHANEGMKVDPGMRVYQIADLSKVWVMVTLYESDLPFVTEGQRAVMTLPYVPGQTFEGKVIYVYPYLEKRTRQVQVRLEFDNANRLLKPGMYANVELKGTLSEKVTLAPHSAVIDTGERQVTFVSLGEGKFEPRDVRLGVETDGGLVQVIDGLKPGEMVVVSGQFLLDSEAKIRDALAKMIKGTSAADQQAVAAVEGFSELKSLPGEAAERLSETLDAYFAIGELLAGDTTNGIAPKARDLAKNLDELLKVDIPDDAHFWHKHEEAATVRGKSLELVNTTAIETARTQYADLSIALAKLTRAMGVPPTYGKQVQELRCPMYREGQGGGTWLQSAGDVRNPYFGASMLRCYDERKVVPVTGAPAQRSEP